MVGEQLINMRIIGGSLKGKNLFFLRNLNTRPLKDNIKENIFNILYHSNLIKPVVKESNVLDLYSGIGSFGIECISRGAKKVSFVEKDKNAYKILRKNIDNLALIDKAMTFNDRIENFLNAKKNEKYNILFFDPPFLTNRLSKIYFFKK